jgi:hypothetical protein
MALSTPTFVRMDDSLLEGVARVAQVEDRNLSGAIRILVKEGLQARGVLPSQRNQRDDDQA